MGSTEKENGAAATGDKPECALLNLPAEIRSTIYRFCLCDDDITITITETFKLPALLSTSRQIRTETAQMWRKSNEFHFDVENCDTKLYVKFVMKVLQPIPLGSGNTWHMSIDMKSVDWVNLVEWCREVHKGRIGVYALKAGNVSDVWAVVQAAMSIADHCRKLPWKAVLAQLKSLRVVAEKLDQAWAAGESSETV